MKHPLVTKKQHVVENSKRYWQDLHDEEHGSYLQATMSRTHHWYMHEDDEGIWATPSKWAGYRNMTAAIYREKYNAPIAEGGLHGRATENQLSQMAKRIDYESSPFMARYSDALDELLAQFGQTRRKGATISILI
jgi:hypothetical protein